MKININEARFIDNEKDLKHKDIVIVDSEAIWVESTKFFKEDEEGNKIPSKDFKVNLKLKNGEIKNATLRYKDNVIPLVEALGDDTKNWIGKELRAWKTKSDKAKIGYIFLYVPIDWERDDTGEWIKGSAGKASDNQDAVKTNEVDSVQIDGELRAEDIPF